MATLDPFPDASHFHSKGRNMQKIKYPNNNSFQQYIGIHLNKLCVYSLSELHLDGLFEVYPEENCQNTELN